MKLSELIAYRNQLSRLSIEDAKGKVYFESDEERQLLAGEVQVDPGIWLWAVQPYFSAEKNIAYYLNDILQKGLTRLYNIETNEYLQIEDVLAEENIDIDFKHTYILIDRLVAKKFEQDELHRIADSIQTAFDETNGDVYLWIEGKELVHFCNRFELDGMRFEVPTPNFFRAIIPMVHVKFAKDMDKYWG